MLKSFLNYSTIPGTPLGPITIGVSELGLAEVLFIDALIKATPANDMLQTALTQVDEFLLGGRRTFDIPIDWNRMPAFQRAVLQLTAQIPFGSVRTYQDIANELGKPGAARAVGQAEARNPMPLVIPCHRVIGSDGKMHGYGGRGGIPTKCWLLKLEGHTIPDKQLSLF